MLSLDRTWPETEFRTRSSTPRRSNISKGTFPPHPNTLASTRASAPSILRSSSTAEMKPAQLRLPSNHLAARGPRVSPSRALRAWSGSAMNRRLQIGIESLQGFGERDDLGFLIVGPLFDCNIEQARSAFGRASSIFTSIFCCGVNRFTLPFETAELPRRRSPRLFKCSYLRTSSPHGGRFTLAAHSTCR